MFKCYHVFEISGLWICGAVAEFPVLIFVGRVQASSQMQNLSPWTCTACWFWPYYLWPTCLLWSYFCTSLLQFCLPVITSLSIVDLLRSLYRMPPAVIKPGRYHICCHAPFCPSQWSQAQPSSFIPTTTQVWVCVPPVLPVFWAITGLEFLVTELICSHLHF